MKLNLWGVILAFISSTFYSFYIVSVDNTVLRRLDGLKITFYVMAMATICILVKQLIQQDFDFYTSPKDLSYGFILGFGRSAISCLALFYGVRYVGFVVCSVLGALEPIVAVA